MQSMMAAETLVENAIAHAPAAGRDDSEPIGERRHLARLIARPWVPAEQREHIFGRFWRESVKESPVAALRLAIVAENHDGAER